MVFGMGVPFAQIADDSLTRGPSRKGIGLVTKRHSFKQVTKPPIPCCRHRRSFNKQMNSVYGTKQKTTRLAVGIDALNMLTECLQRTRRKMQQSTFVAGGPGTYELHMGQSRSCGGSQSGVASCWVWLISRVRNAGE